MDTEESVTQKIQADAERLEQEALDDCNEHHDTDELSQVLEKSTFTQDLITDIVEKTVDARLKELNIAVDPQKKVAARRRDRAQARIAQEKRRANYKVTPAAESGGYPEITLEQRRAAGYCDIPAGAQLPAPISLATLRGNMANQAVPLPKDFLSGDMFGEGAIQIFGSDGTNLLDSASDRRLALLEQKLTKSTDADADGMSTGKEIVTINDRILSIPLARELGIKAEDIAISAANEGEITKVLQNKGQGLTLVKPFSIPAGIIGGNDKVLVAFDRPDFRTGQPGQLLGIFRKDTFRSVPHEEVVYNPNVEFDVNTQTITNDTLKMAQDHARLAPPAGVVVTGVESQLTDKTSVSDMELRLAELMASRQQ